MSSNTVCRPLVWALLPIVLLLAAPALAVDIQDTRLLHEPTVSAQHVVFVYGDDLWRADLDGSDARRLTSHPGRESRPHISPDGKWVAFSGQYDGNVDVFIMSIDGGVPRRLTYHPSPDLVTGFSPDGQVVFSSGRDYYTNRRFRLFSVPTAGGMPTPLIIPYGFDAAYSPDGSHLAYTPQREAFTSWKNYRGGTAARIWLFDFADHSVAEIPQPEGRCNDDDPIWLGDKIYFRSDRNGEFNLFSYDPATRAVEQLTRHEDFPVLAASGGDGLIAYAQGGYLHLYDPAQGTAQRLRIGVAADLVETRQRYVDGKDFIRNADISPSGVRAVFETRGEIVTVPAEKGDPRNLTETLGANERDPRWSPDGRWVAYFSDASGEYRLHLAPQDGKGEVKVLDPHGSGFYDDLRWAPDSKKLSYTDNSWSTYWIDVASGAVHKISADTLYGPIKSLSHSWSPDSGWIAYTRNTPTNLRQVFVYSLAEDRSYPITDGLSDVDEPVFDTGGKYLHFYASTDSGPLRQWFAQSNQDADFTGALYTVVLSAGEASPFAPQSDEEMVGDAAKGDSKEAAKTGSTDDKKGKKKDKDKDGAEGDEGAAKEAPAPVKIDFAGIEQRILALPLGPGRYRSLEAGAAGQLFYLKAGYPDGFGGGGPTSLCKFDFDKREETTLLANADGFALSADGKKVLVASGDKYQIADTGAPIDASKGQLALDAIQLKIDPRQEWPQIFDEAWRINRDYFYDPGMHGADWPAMREKYAQFLPDLATRDDLNTVIGWMNSELAVGHHYLFGGDFLYHPDEIPGGLLGADLDVANGRYRFAKVYGGLNWNPDLRAPLTEPGVDVKAGEYLLAVDGEELHAGDNLYRPFENTADHIVELKVGPNADGKGSRTVQVRPIANELALRNRAWVESNREKVDRATGGRVAYVHVPDTAVQGHTYFKRYFYPQAYKDAIIVDERHNGGGQIADYYIDLLRRPLISYWATRYGDAFKAPLASIQGPKVMLIDETAGSGGDMLPWMFRKLEVGTLVGKRTWGGLVGILGFPQLMDGGFITAPNVGFWTPEEGYGIENQGVPPDVDVEQLPSALIEGHDPQLEKAIEIALEKLEANPPVKPVQPPFPVRVRQPKK